MSTQKKMRSETQMMFFSYDCTNPPVYGSETWVLIEKVKNHTQVTEMRFLRYIEGCTRGDRL